MRNAKAGRGMPPAACRISVILFMRILHITPYFYPAWLYGGVVHSLWGLARAQAADGHEVRVLTTDVLDETRRDPGPRERREQGVLARYLPNVSNRAAQRAQVYLPRSGWDVAAEWVAWAEAVHFHCHRILFFHPLKLFLKGKPYLLSPRGSASLVEGRLLRKRFYDLLAGDAFLEGAARLFALSEAERTGLVARGIDPARTDVIPHGIDWPGTPPAAGPAGREGGEILYLGKITPLKGIEDLLQAVAGLPGARLVVAGNDNGGYQERLRAMASEWGVADRVRFAGFLSGEDKEKALVRASCVAVPSRYEAFGLVPLEALAAGTPTVVSGAAGCADGLSGVDGVFIVDVEDPVSLRKGLEKALDFPASGGPLARRAREALEGRFGWPAIARRYESAYREALA